MSAGPAKLALVAHDGTKPLLLDWAAARAARLALWPILATGTTGGLLAARLPTLDVERVESGPRGGDQQIGARIVEGRVAALIFFVDPLTAQPHDVDVKALIRLAALKDVPMALSPSAADLVLAGLVPPG